MNAAALTIVLIHGGFVDGSGWEGVYNILKKDGYNVAVVQNPTTSLADDVAFTKRVIAAQPGKSLLVGHSYGGVVITEAGTDPKVAGLVYVAAFAPDKGESVASLIKNPPPGAPVPPDPASAGRLPPARPSKVQRGVRRRPRRAEGQLHGGVAGAVGRRRAVGRGHLPAWKTKPSWYLVATDDRMIPPPAQRQMSQRAGAEASEAPGSHAVYISQPGAVADLIKKAATAVSK